ncbi:hypothetical protein ACFQ3Z_15110 [Streptomyces nogalater]
MQVALLPPITPRESHFRFAPVAGEEDTYEILHGPDKGSRSTCPTRPDSSP